jgi:hypothetical protein
MGTKDVEQHGGKSDIASGILKRFAQIVVILLLQAAILLKIEH